MNKQLFAAIGLAVSIAGASAQGVDPLAPSSVSPKPAPETEPPPAAAPVLTPTPSTHSPRSPEGNKPINPDQPNLAIKGIVLVAERQQIKEAGIPEYPEMLVQIHDLPFLDNPDFKYRLGAFISLPVTENNIRDLEDFIILYCRQHGHLLTDVILPEQDIESGVLQFWVLEGKVGQVTVENEGRKWFKDGFILGQTHLRPGEPVDSKQLNKDLNWLNNNPFRQVDVTFSPGEKLGLTDVGLRVDDRIPVRPYFGYENTGTRFTGRDRYLFGMNWGNAFWLDQQLNYQYATDTDFNLVKANSGSWIIPLPWRHTLIFYGSYVDAKAEFGQSTDTTADGHSWQTSFRYSIPLPDIKVYRNEVSLGFDFKRGNNNLLSGGTNVLQHSDTDIAQFVLAYSGVQPDPYGRTSLGFELFYSPGDMTQYNHDDYFNQLRVDAKAKYFYGRAHLERITRLPENFSWILTCWGQFSTERLLPSEELALGGYSTVRGYDELAVLGDQGWIIDNELRTPTIHPGELFHVPQLEDQLQFLAFMDYGAVRIVDIQPADGNDANTTLFSTGVGLRYMARKNLSVRFDYGWPLTDHTINGYSQHSRGAFGVLLSF